MLSRQVRQYLCLILKEHILCCQVESSPHSHSVSLYLFASFCARVGHPSAFSLQAWPMKVCISHVLNHAVCLFRLIMHGLIILLLNSHSSTT